MAVPRNLHAIRTMRKNSWNGTGLTASLDLGQMGRFLQQTLPKLTSDRDLADVARGVFHALQLKLSTENDSSMAVTCRDELLNCSTVLSSFLSSAWQLPGTVIFDAHSYIGCIQETLQQYKLASQSFTKALWIASCVGEMVSMEQLAVCLHQLGRVYGVMGRYKEANDLIQQALLKYNLAHVHHDHMVVNKARELVAFHDQRQRQIQMATTAAASSDATTTKYKQLHRVKSSLSRSTLSLIREESNPSERRSSL